MTLQCELYIRTKELRNFFSMSVSKLLWYYINDHNGSVASISKPWHHPCGFSLQSKNISFFFSGKHGHPLTMESSQKYALPNRKISSCNNYHLIMECPCLLPLCYSYLLSSVSSYVLLRFPKSGDREGAPLVPQKEKVRKILQLPAMP